jgi:ribosomal protein L23
MSCYFLKKLTFSATIAFFAVHKPASRAHLKRNCKQAFKVPVEQMHFFVFASQQQQRPSLSHQHNTNVSKQHTQ